MRDFYNNYWVKRGQSSFRPRYKVFADWLQDNAKVLDIGCGDGTFLEYCKKSLPHLQALGVDIAEQAVAFCRQCGVEAKVVDISQPLPFADESFDYVVASEVLEHLIETEKTLLDCKRLAKKGVLVSIPNIAFYKHRFRLFFKGKFPKQWALDPKEHLRYFSVSDFLALVESLGFKVKEIKFVSGTRGLRSLWPNLFADQSCFYLIK